MVSDTAIIVVGVVVLSVLVCGTLLLFRAFGAIVESAGGGQGMANQALAHMQSNFGQMSGRMERWFEETQRIQNHHAERMQASRVAPLADQGVVARAQSEERMREQATSAAHSTNDRKASMHEFQAAAAADHMPIEPQRQQVPMSDMTQAVALKNEGRVPVKA